MNLLQAISDDDGELKQNNQNNTSQRNISITAVQLTKEKEEKSIDKEQYSDLRLNKPTIENVSLNSPISKSNSSCKIRDTSHGCDSQKITRMNDICSEHTNMPSPNGSVNLFGDEKQISSVASLPTDDSVSSPISQYSSGEEFVPSSSERRFTKKKDSGRLREKNCRERIDTKRKRLKNTGKSYYSRNGTMRSGKKLGEPCPNSCKLKCSQKLDDGARVDTFNKFWEIGDHSKQYEFISNHVVRINKKRAVTEGDSRRSFTYIYHLPGVQSNQNSKLIVCKQMFLNTLSCGPKMIRTAIAKSSGTVTLVDNRGRHKHHKTKMDSEMIKSICDHVNSIKLVDDDGDTNKLYADGSLSFARMYNLYTDWFDPTKYGAKCESLRQYRDVVKQNMNLSIRQRKKESKSRLSEIAEITEKFESRIINKNLSRSLKEEDKNS